MSPCWESACTRGGSGASRSWSTAWSRRRPRATGLYGATTEDSTQVKVKNATHGLSNPNARYRKRVTPEDVEASPVVADPLRLLDICATSDGAAAVVVTSMDYARRHTTSPV